MALRDALLNRISFLDLLDHGTDSTAQEHDNDGIKLYEKFEYKPMVWEHALKDDKPGYEVKEAVRRILEKARKISWFYSSIFLNYFLINVQIAVSSRRMTLKKMMMEITSQKIVRVKAAERMRPRRVRRVKKTTRLQLPRRAVNTAPKRVRITSTLIAKIMRAFLKKADRMILKRAKRM